MKRRNKNIPFTGSVWKVRGSIISYFPNRRTRRKNNVPNSSKLGKGSENNSEVFRTNKYGKRK